MYIFRKLNVIGVWRVLNWIKLLVTLYIHGHLPLNNGLPSFAPHGSYSFKNYENHSIIFQLTLSEKQKCKLTISYMFS